MRLYVLLILLLGLSGCAGPTPYQSGKAGGGYSDQTLGSDTHQIVFEGDYQTPKAVAVEYALLRAAEVTRQAGFPYFQVLSAEANLETLTITKPPYIRQLQAYPGTAHTRVDLSDEAVRKHERPVVVMVVKFLRESQGGDYVLPAEEVIAEIKSRHNIEDKN